MLCDKGFAEAVAGMQLLALTMCKTAYLHSAVIIKTQLLWSMWKLQEPLKCLSTDSILFPLLLPLLAQSLISKIAGVWCNSLAQTVGRHEKSSNGSPSCKGFGQRHCFTKLLFTGHTDDCRCCDMTPYAFL